MNKTVQIGLILISVGLLSALIKSYIKGSENKYSAPLPEGKDYYAKIIMDAGYITKPEVLKTFDGEFVRAWAEGILNGRTIFIYKGANYRVKGGRRI